MNIPCSKRLANGSMAAPLLAALGGGRQRTLVSTSWTEFTWRMSRLGFVLLQDQHEA